MVGGLLHVLFFSWMYACSDEAAENDSPTQISAPLSSIHVEGATLVKAADLSNIDTPELKGQSSIAYHPHELSPQATFFAKFLNNTSPYLPKEQINISTGKHQQIGKVSPPLPLRPSVFKQYLQQTEQASGKHYYIERHTYYTKTSSIAQP